jgi:putative phosphoribosyl transferase
MKLASNTSILIPAGTVELRGDLRLAGPKSGIVLFVHGSGSSRKSPRNRYVAEALLAKGIGSLLFDLLTPAEDADHSRRFDISLLLGRLHAAYQWIAMHRELGHPPVGLFGASTGAAAALQLAAILDGSIRAVVSRGGRPDLAGPAALAHVDAPTLLIVGGNDAEVLRLNQTSFEMLPGEDKALRVIPGATHLFEEPGALETVANLAADWFARHFASEAVRGNAAVRRAGAPHPG